MATSLSADLATICVSRNDDVVAIGFAVSQALSGSVKRWIGVRGAMPDAIATSTHEVFADVANSSPRQLISFRALRVALKIASDADRVLIASPAIANIPLLAALGRKELKISAIVHDVTPHYDGVRGFLYKAQNRAVFKNSSDVYVFSEYSRQQAMSQGAQSVTALPLPSPAEPIKWKTPCSPRIYDFAFFGRFEEYKGVKDLPQIASAANDSGLRLLVASRTHAQNPVIKELRSHANVDIRLGSTSTAELVDLVRQAKRVICPYRSATQSGAISFAHAVGRPVVATATGAMPEQLSNPILGVVVDDFSAETLAAVAAVSPADETDIRAHYMNNCSFEALINTLRDHESKR